MVLNIIKLVYNIVLHDLELYPKNNSWVKSVKHILNTLAFCEAWYFQGEEDVNIVLYLL